MPAVGCCSLKGEGAIVAPRTVTSDESGHRYGPFSIVFQHLHLAHYKDASSFSQR